MPDTPPGQPGYEVDSSDHHERVPAELAAAGAMLAAARENDLTRISSSSVTTMAVAAMRVVRNYLHEDVGDVL